MNEITFMEIRLFRMFRERYNKQAKDVNQLFEKYGIWTYIEECYDTLHVMSDECALRDITDILVTNGVQL